MSLHYFMHFFVACLFVRRSLLFWDFLIDVEDTWDVEFHAVEVISNHSPKLIQTRVTSFCNLRKKRRSKNREDQYLYIIKLFVDDNRIALHYLDNLPRHIEDAASCSAEEAPQACDGTTSDHSSAHWLSLPIQQPPPLFPLLSLLQL